MTTQRFFEKELTALVNDILRLGSLVEEAVFNAIQSFINQDEALAKQVIANDDRIDALTDEIENHCIRLIATLQPTARDLRVIVTGLKIILNLERMGDHASDIARAALNVCEVPRLSPSISEAIVRIAQLVQQMLKDSLDAYARGDVSRARSLSSADDEVDHLYNRVFRTIIENMEEDPANIRCGVYFLLVALRLERIADRATNIGEDVIYLVTGEWETLN
ncbi:phosphate signaling complex protein PhoU [Ammonifex thiophilus]|uniref:Phosphate-specific transport system accessory protein PhoU n=1 Tax=Ammonifex thiophilus TaxID=444093 RepID=A0A3D8P5H9_9THEO|nr:phosphate signaling complex protein PhoU [Ammonifex thiophilus]RDV83562.1 phosphate transport system regulatory protein PhoU [Ammonifex thiophilus]